MFTLMMATTVFPKMFDTAQKVMWLKSEVKYDATDTNHNSWL
jgi:hypothetical protein